MSRASALEERGKLAFFGLGFLKWIEDGVIELHAV